MKKWILFAVLSACGIVPASAQTQLQKYLPGATPEGAVYFLPKTAVRISVKIEKTTFQPGEFCRYAQKYLRLSDAGQEAWTSHRVLSLKQTPIAVADTSKRYALKFNPKSAAVNIQLSDEGCLLAINPAPQAPPSAPEGATIDPAPPYKTIEAPSGAVGGAGTSGAVGGSLGSSGSNYLTEEILAAGSTAKMAQLTAEEIFDIRENRSLLIKGQADFNPKDGRQLELMLQELDKQDRALTSLFAGVTVCDTTEHVVVFTPDAPTTDRMLLFRLSQMLGMVDADDLSGEPFYITVEDLRAMPPVDEEAAAKVKKKTYEAGVYVNVPGRMRTTIYRGIDALQTAEMPASQFGYTQLLSGALFNNRFTTRLLLSPLTGAVERMEAEQPKK